MVDTGASFTILPVEVVKRLGYDTSHPVRMARLAAASGIIVAPVIKISWLNSLGWVMKNFEVAVHTIPSPAFDGVLGMDFLHRCKAIISIADAEIYFRETKAGKV